MLKKITCLYRNKNFTLKTEHQLICNFFISFLLFLIIIVFHTKSTSSAESMSVTDYTLLSYMQSLNDLPDYCSCKLTELKYYKELRSVRDPKITNWPKKFDRIRKYWKKRLHPQTWLYMHHYCRGIKWFNEYSRMSYEKKNTMQGKGKIKMALQEFQFMQNAKVHPSFPLYYEMYTYLSNIYMYLGQPQKAQWALAQAIRHKRKP